MGKGQKGHSDDRRKKRKQAACILCTIILVIVIIVLAVLYFSLFKPKDPTVQVPTMQLISLYPSGYSVSITSVNISLILQVSMYNPNRATFYVQDGSTACLYYYGTQVGYAPVPPGSLPSQSYATVSVGLTVQGPTPLQGSYLSADVASGILQVSTSVTIIGKVTTLNIFSHNSDVISKCYINVSFNARGIEAYTCQKSYSLYG